MPPTRSKKKATVQSKAKSKAKQNPVRNTDDATPAPSSTSIAEENPPGDSASPNKIKYIFERVRGDNLGLPLKDFYSKKIQPEVYRVQGHLTKSLTLCLFYIVWARYSLR